MQMLRVGFGYLECAKKLGKSSLMSTHHLLPIINMLVLGASCLGFGSQQKKKDENCFSGLTDH